MPGDILDCHSWGRMVASSGRMPKMLLNILQWPGQSPSPPKCHCCETGICVYKHVYIFVYVCVYSFFFSQILPCDHKHSWWAVDWMTKYFCKPHLWSLSPLFSGGKIIPTVPVLLVCTYSSLSLSFLTCFPVSSSWTSPYPLGGPPAFFPLSLCWH